MPCSHHIHHGSESQDPPVHPQYLAWSIDLHADVCVVGQDTDNVRQFIADPGETTDWPILGTGVSCGKGPGERWEWKNQNAIPAVCTGSGKTNPETSVVWPYCCWNHIQKDTLATQHCVDQMRKALKSEQQYRPAQTPSTVLHRVGVSTVQV